MPDGSGKKQQVVRDDVANGLLVINGRSYSFDYDNLGTTLLAEMDVKDFNARIDRLILKLRGYLVVDDVLRHCITGQPLDKLKFIDSALRSGIKPVMRLMGGGEFVEIEIGRYYIPITDGMSPGRDGIAECLKLKRLKLVDDRFTPWYVVAGHQQEIFDYIEYNILSINGSWYAFDSIDDEISSLTEVDSAVYCDMIDGLVERLRCAFDADVVLRQCLKKLLDFDLLWFEHKCRSKSLKLEMFRTLTDIYLVVGKRHPCFLGVGTRCSDFRKSE